MSGIHEVSVALLAGGLATRLRPVTQKIPKALIVVGGRPFIEHQLELLRRSGIRRVVLCLGHLGEMVREHLDKSPLAREMDLAYSFDGPKLLGTGGAIRRALPLLGEVFWIMYGDSYMEIDYAAVLRTFDASPEALGLMTVIHNADRWDKSNVVWRDGRLIRYDKKERSSEMKYVDYGVALLKSEAAWRIPEDAATDLADLYKDLVREGKMVGYEVHQRFYEIGTPASLAEADAYLLARESEGKQKR